MGIGKVRAQPGTFAAYGGRSQNKEVIEVMLQRMCMATIQMQNLTPTAHYVESSVGSVDGLIQGSWTVIHSIPDTVSLVRAIMECHGKARDSYVEATVSRSILRRPIAGKITAIVPMTRETNIEYVITELHALSRRMNFISHDTQMRVWCIGNNDRIARAIMDNNARGALQVVGVQYETTDNIEAEAVVRALTSDLHFAPKRETTAGTSHPTVAAEKGPVIANTMTKEGSGRPVTIMRHSQVGGSGSDNIIPNDHTNLVDDEQSTTVAMDDSSEEVDEESLDEDEKVKVRFVAVMKGSGGNLQHVDSVGFSEDVTIGELYRFTNPSGLGEQTAVLYYDVYNGKWKRIGADSKRPAFQHICIAKVPLLITLNRSARSDFNATSTRTAIERLGLNVDRGERFDWTPFTKMIVVRKGQRGITLRDEAIGQRINDDMRRAYQERGEGRARSTAPQVMDGGRALRQRINIDAQHGANSNTQRSPNRLSSQSSPSVNRYTIDSAARPVGRNRVTFAPEESDTGDGYDELEDWDATERRRRGNDRSGRGASRTGKTTPILDDARALTELSKAIKASEFKEIPTTNNMVIQSNTLFAEQITNVTSNKLFEGLQPRHVISVALTKVTAAPSSGESVKGAVSMLVKHWNDKLRHEDEVVTIAEFVRDLMTTFVYASAHPFHEQLDDLSQKQDEDTMDYLQRVVALYLSLRDFGGGETTASDSQVFTKMLSGMDRSVERQLGVNDMSKIQTQVDNREVTFETAVNKVMRKWTYVMAAKRRNEARVNRNSGDRGIPSTRSSNNRPLQRRPTLAPPISNRTFFVDEDSDDGSTDMKTSDRNTNETEVNGPEYDREENDDSEAVAAESLDPNITGVYMVGDYRAPEQVVQRSGNGGGSKTEPVCYSCGAAGHFSNKCPKYNAKLPFLSKDKNAAGKFDRDSEKRLMFHSHGIRPDQRKLSAGKATSNGGTAGNNHRYQ
jgi:hypothetical protein